MTWLAVLFSSYIISLSDKMDPMKKNIREKAMMWKEWKDYVVMQITRLAWQLPRHSAFNSDVQYMANIRYVIKIVQSNLDRKAIYLHLLWKLILV